MIKESLFVPLPAEGRAADLASPQQILEFDFHLKRIGYSCKKKNSLLCSPRGLILLDIDQGLEGFFGMAILPAPAGTRPDG